MCPLLLESTRSNPKEERPELRAWGTHKPHFNFVSHGPDLCCLMLSGAAVALGLLCAHFRASVSEQICVLG